MDKQLGAVRLCLIPVFLSLFFINTLFAQGSDGATPADSSATASVAPAPSNNGGIPSDPNVISQGMGLFNGNCKQCHAVHDKVVGPALKNVWERKPVSWIINFVKYPQKTIESGDEYAVSLYKQYNQFMPNHDFLQDAEIVAILAYVKDESGKGPVVPAPGDKTTSGEQPSEAGTNSNLLIAIIVGLLVLLVIIVGVMFLLVSVLTKYIRQEKELTEEEQEYLSQRFNLGKIIRSPAFIGIVAFIFLNVAAKTSVDSIFSIGVQQGYAPEQPIQFSHKLHAGYYEIDCKYCHSTVEKSKSANIPSANVCMNCHNSIRTTSPEIQKLYTYIENDEPIQWIRVHNLPDLAYFNHSQHVKVAGLECQRCHGQIQEMEVVQQHSLLTMGWCIDCHRETEVKTQGNAYYDRLVEMHKATDKEPLRVENIGGLECSKCHY
jgi:mono/diheme cytochrome c family protein